MEKGLATIINHASPEFKHTIVCMTKSGASKFLLRDDIKIIEMNKKEGNSLFFIFRLMKVFKQLNPDIVHTRNWGGLDGVIAARLAGISHIVHGEHGWSMDDPDGLNRKRVFIRRVINLFIKKYTCVSRQMKTWLEKDIKVGKEVIQIYNGVDCNLFCPGRDNALKSELGIDPGTIVMGIVARLDPIKNHAGLIKAFNKVHAEHPHTCLLIIGEGSERAKLEEISGSGIIFLGNRPDVYGLLKCMDIFILPSFNEGISNTILEAMAS
ncbi:MAG: glycosyltransferase, partial [Deltaproteobacteria bacterium]|nr:glycosyltransferase [Deltaproteobacteria bacterium]